MIASRQNQCLASILLSLYASRQETLVLENEPRYLWEIQNRAQSCTMLRHFKHFELFNYQQWLQMIAKYMYAWVEVLYWFVYSIAFKWMPAICIMKHGIHVNLYLQLSPLWRKRMCSKDKMHPCHHEIKYYNPPYIFSCKYLRINVLAIIKQRTRCVVHVPYLMIFYITFKHLPKIPYAISCHVYKGKLLLDQDQIRSGAPI